MGNTKYESVDILVLFTFRIGSFGELEEERMWGPLRREPILG